MRSQNELTKLSFLLPLFSRKLLFTHHRNQVVDVPHILVVLWAQLDVSLRRKRQAARRKGMTSGREERKEEEEEVRKKSRGSSQSRPSRFVS